MFKKIFIFIIFSISILNIYGESLEERLKIAPSKCVGLEARGRYFEETEVNLTIDSEKIRLWLYNIKDESDSYLSLLLFIPWVKELGFLPIPGDTITDFSKEPKDFQDFLTQIGKIMIQKKKNLAITIIDTSKEYGMLVIGFEKDKLYIWPILLF